MQWLIDPIPLESDKTLTNGPKPAWAVLRRMAGSWGAAVSVASLVPLSHHTSSGCDQWDHCSDSHTHDRSWARHPMIKRPRGYCFRTIHLMKEKKIIKLSSIADTLLFMFLTSLLLSHSLTACMSGLMRGELRGKWSRAKLGSSSVDHVVFYLSFFCAKTWYESCDRNGSYYSANTVSDGI